MAELNDSAGSPFANIYFATADSSSQNELIPASDTIPDNINLFDEVPASFGQIGGFGEYAIKGTWGRTWQN